MYYSMLFYLIKVKKTTAGNTRYKGLLLYNHYYYIGKSKIVLKNKILR